MKTWQKIALWVSVTAVMVTGGILVYLNYFTGGGLTPSAKKNRKIKFKRGEATSSFTATSWSVGDEKIIDVPAMDASPNASDVQKSQMQITLATIATKYGTYINNIATLTNVKPEIIKSFIYVESNGQAGVIGGTNQWYGLMQMAPTSASASLKIENDTGRLSDGEKAIVKKYLPTINFAAPVVTGNDLLNPELNILLGSIILGQLIDDPKNTEDRVVDVKPLLDTWATVSTKDSGTLPVTTNPKTEVKTEKVLRLDKVIIYYNSGIGAKIITKGDATAVCAERGGINCAYIKKIMGTSGTLDLLVA